MNPIPLYLLAGALSLAAVARPAHLAITETTTHSHRNDAPMQLGNFSVSLAVKDLAASRAFYEKLGFEQVGGNADQNWLILQNGTTTIGLFQGMFDNNIMTFNPGWDKDKSTLESFEDVRDLERRIIESGIEPVTRVAADSTGPGHFVIVDPDGNSILFDQHVASPKD